MEKEGANTQKISTDWLVGEGQSGLMEKEGANTQKVSRQQEAGSREEGVEGEPMNMQYTTPKGGNKRTACTAHSTARSFLGCCFTHFWLIFSVAEMRWLRGFTYNNGLHSILLTIAMVVVAAHTPCRGGGR